MPRFFVDLEDGAVHKRDDEGIEARDLEDAKERVLEALPLMARDALAERENLTMAANVRDESGQVALTVVLKIEVARHVGTQLS
jgi:hypothetical protein